MKKNVVIIILSILVLSLGGYLVYDKVLSSDNKVSGNNLKCNNGEEIISAKDYDLTKAKELVDKYYNGHYYGSSFDNMSEEAMLRNAFEKAKPEDYNCTTLYENDERASVYGNDYLGKPATYKVELEDESFVICDNTNSRIVSYDNMNKIYKELYGKELEVEKKAFGHRLRSIYYDSKNDIFAVAMFYGGSGYNEKRFYDVKSAKIVDGQLIIDIGYEVFEPCNEEPFTETKYCGCLNDDYVTSYDDSIEKETFIKDNLDKFDTYRFIFEKEDDHYILKNYIKILK